MIRVFLSYAREDQERVERLYQNLAAAGFKPWMDVHDLAPGEEWLQGIQRGIAEADCFLACISPRSIVKDGVLGDELRASLERWRKRRGNYRLIPVRLEDSDIESLKHLQWFNLFSDDQWTGLATAIRRSGPRHWLYAAAAATVILAAALAWWFWIHDRGARWPPGPVRVGVTLWRLREATASDPNGSKILVQPPPQARSAAAPQTLVPLRTTFSAMFSVGDRVRASFESAQEGYLYVIDRERLEGGGMGPPKLIFPTRQIRGGDNKVYAGQLIEMPSLRDDPPYWELQKLNERYVGELLTVIFAVEPIPGLEPAAEARDVDEAWFGARLKEWDAPVNKTETAAGQLATSAEIEAGRSGSKTLKHGDPKPQTTFSGIRGRGQPLVASFPLQIAK